MGKMKDIAIGLANEHVKQAFPLTVLHLRNAVSGLPYRKTLQYGFDLQQAVDAMAGRPKPRWRKPAWYNAQLDWETEADMYACGFLNPHYPVPALRLDADINDERVQVYNDTQHKLAYYYSFENLN